MTTISGLDCIRSLIAKTERGSHVNHAVKFPILLTARVTSAVLSTSISKFLVDTSGICFALALFVYIACSAVITSVAVLQATEVDQSLFVPASACDIQFVNASTGLIIW
jgi:hypothetical protein